MVSLGQWDLGIKLKLKWTRSWTQKWNMNQLEEIKIGISLKDLYGPGIAQGIGEDAKDHKNYR